MKMVTLQTQQNAGDTTGAVALPDGSSASDARAVQLMMHAPGYTDTLHTLQASPTSEFTTPPTPPVKGPAILRRLRRPSLGNGPRNQTFEQDTTLLPRHGYGAPNIGHGFHPTTSTYPYTVSAQSSRYRNEDVVANVVIFGETGVGKSSLINLIANANLARTSNDALGCTFRFEKHEIPLEGILCTIWDTTGLEEGSEGSVPAKLAENNLRELMRGLTNAGGIHLIIYCVRGTRLTKALRRNYDVFYATVCRKKVPVALVVTGLEHQEGAMETWWTDNEAALRRHGMWFDAHACVTTLDVWDDVIQQRRSESRDELRELIVKYSRLSGWKADSSVFSRVLPLFAAISRGASSVILGNPVRRVAVCGAPSWVFPGTTVFWDKIRATIGDKEFRFVRVDKHDLYNGQSEALSQSIGLLIFYTSADRMSTDLVALKKFHDIAGGHSLPMIIVLEGCDDEHVAWEYHVQISSQYRDMHLHVVPDKMAGSDLDKMIETLCIEQAEGVTQRLWKSLVRS